MAIPISTAKLRKRGAGFIILAALLTLTACHEDRAMVTAPLEAGSESIIGMAWCQFDSFANRFGVDASGLVPGEPYEIWVGDIIRVVVTADDTGSLAIVLSRDGSDESFHLDFDPRGKRVELRRGDMLVATTVVSGDGEPAGTTVEEQSFLRRVGAGVTGSARVRFRQDADGRRRFDVEVEDAQPGAYAVLVAGVERGILDAPGGFGELEFSTRPDPDELPLDFDPRGAAVALLLNGVTVFGGVAEAQIPDINVCGASESEDFLPPGPDYEGGKAKLRRRVRDDCDRDVRVEIEVPSGGDHLLIVNGIERAVIATAFDPTEGAFRGEVEFDTDPDEAHELPLDFDTLGASVEIVRASDGAVLFATGSGSGGGGTGGGTGSTGTCENSEVFARLDPPSGGPASGEARSRERNDCRADFRVEIEDVPAGTYTLRVGGEVVGSFAAVSTAGGVRGEIDFDDEVNDPGELPLTFDPRGKHVEVLNAGGTPVLTGDVPE